MSVELGVQVRPILLTSRGFAVITSEWLTPRKSGAIVRALRWCGGNVLSLLRSIEALVEYGPMLAVLIWSGCPQQIAELGRLMTRTLNRLLPRPLHAPLRELARFFASRLEAPDAGSPATRWIFLLLRLLLVIVVWAGSFASHFFMRALAIVARAARSAGRLVRRGFRSARAARSALSRGLLALRLRNKHVVIGSGDVLLLADSNWDSGHLWPHVVEARKRGAIVASVVYDLIPLRAPDFVDDNLKRLFTHHLGQTARNNDFIIAISRDTRLDFLDFARSTPNPGWCEDRARTFRLGSDNWTGVVGTCSDHCKGVVRRVGDSAAYLIVGTFEVRKNHRAVLDAFDQLWDEGADLCLLILGKAGFRAGDQMARVRSHREWGKRLFWATSASDGDLESWYQISRGVIMASYAEGFGLPVAEALARGKPAIVSDIPAHREIAHGFCDFFDPSRPDELAGLIRRDLVGDRNPGLKPVADFEWPDWPQSVRECLRECIATASLGPRAS